MWYVAKTERYSFLRISSLRQTSDAKLNHSKTTPGVGCLIAILWRMLLCVRASHWLTSWIFRSFAQSSSFQFMPVQFNVARISVEHAHSHVHAHDAMNEGWMLTHVYMYMYTCICMILPHVACKTINKLHQCYLYPAKYRHVNQCYRTLNIDVNNWISESKIMAPGWTQ